MQHRRRNNWSDFLNFKTMIAPTIIQVLFWVGVLGCIFQGLGALIGSDPDAALGWLLLGPLVMRLYCELLIVIFTINDTLTEIRNLLKPTLK